MKYSFIPLLPTKAAYENMAFSDYACEKTLLEGLKKKDIGDMLRGYIYFNQGIVSEWKDGTERVTKDTRKWWELGYTSCSRGCCVSPPCPSLINWKSEDGDEALTLAVKEHREMAEANMAEHAVRPRPMPRFKSEVVPHKRGWQEFKRVTGPGGLEEQLSLIKDKSTIWKIYFVNYGSFVLR
jgi:hypothetical protein